MLNEFFSIFLTFFLVMNVFGMIPTYLSLLHHFDESQWKKIAFRELFFALMVMLFFYFIGPIVLELLEIKPTTTEVTGGVLIFLISLRLIFGHEDAIETWEPGKHLLVPMATPVIASPALLATIMIYVEGGSDEFTILLALFFTWFVVGLIYLGANGIYKTLKQKGLDACQRLMGLLLGLIAVEKILHGIHEYFR